MSLSVVCAMYVQPTRSFARRNHLRLESKHMRQTSRIEVFLPLMDEIVSIRSVKERRTPWMKAIGILDIIIGVFGALLNGLLLYAAADIHLAMRTIDSSLQYTTERQFFAAEAMTLATRAEAEFSEANVFILIDLSFNVVMTLALVVIGFATLRLARWARWGSIGWSLVCIAWLVFISIVEPVEFDEWGLLIFLYPFTLLYLFTRSSWKTTFNS